MSHIHLEPIFLTKTFCAAVIPLHWTVYLIKVLKSFENIKQSC